MKEPTADQCEANELLHEDEKKLVYAMWYPQMGGYVGRAVVEITKESEPGCFDVYVWHDGAFPFNSSDGCYPARIHHCAADQFVEFGSTVDRLQLAAAKSIQK